MTERDFPRAAVLSGAGHPPPTLHQILEVLLAARARIRRTLARFASSVASHRIHQRQQLRHVRTRCHNVAGHDHLRVRITRLSGSSPFAFCSTSAFSAASSSSAALAIFRDEETPCVRVRAAAPTASPGGQQRVAARLRVGVQDGRQVPLIDHQSTDEGRHMPLGDQLVHRRRQQSHRLRVSRSKSLARTPSTLSFDLDLLGRAPRRSTPRCHRPPAGSRRSDTTRGRCTGRPPHRRTPPGDRCAQRGSPSPDGRSGPPG